MVFSTFVALIVGPELRDHLVDWVEKASFDRLSKLFEIDAKERQCKTLLTARNLTAVVREPQEYVINILPRKMLITTKKCYFVDLIIMVLSTFE